MSPIENCFPISTYFSICQEKVGLKKQLCSELQNSVQHINDRIQAYWWGKTPVI